MAKVVSLKKLWAWGRLPPWASFLFATLVGAPSSALAQGRDAKATTEAQKEAQAQEQGVRALGAMDLIDPNDPTLREVPMERRSSFTMGLSIGAALGSAAGFPNDPSKIGLTRYYTDAGIGSGYGGRIWAGVALRDFLTVGLTFGSSGLDAGDEVVFTGMVGFHVETFPVYFLGGAWRDAGVMLDAGVATGIVTPEGDTSTLLVDGGLASALGGGLFYEGIRFGPKLAMGPYLAYDYRYNASIRSGEFILGWRTAIYPRQK
jgi:hypothetical protein